MVSRKRRVANHLTTGIRGQENSTPSGKLKSLRNQFKEAREVQQALLAEFSLMLRTAPSQKAQEEEG